MALTKGDFKNLEELISLVFDRKFEENQVVTLKDLKYLPTKDEFYKKEDEVLGEIQKLRDEVAVTTLQYRRTNKRVDLMDKNLGIDTSSVT